MTLKAARNILILAAIAAAADFLPQGGRTADTISAVLSFTFAAVLALILGRLYQENKIRIHSLGDRYRALLYGAAAVGVATIAATQRLWNSGGGELAWFVLIFGVVYAFVVVIRHYRTY